MQLHILGGIDDELQTHIVERLGDDDATDEVDRAPHLTGRADRRLGLLGGGNVQRGVHHLARKLDIRAVLDGKRLQRNDRQLILHLTVGQRIATRQLQIVGRRVDHTQRTATHQIDIVGVVAVEVGFNVGALRHVDGHIHAETRQRRPLDDHLGGVAEVYELHQRLHLVVGSQRCVAQDVAHIGRRQHAQAATHVQIVEGSLHTGIEVDKRLAEGHAVVAFLGANELEVLGTHAEIGRDMVEIVEIDIALNIQRILVDRVDGKVLEQEVGVLYAHGVVVETQRDAIGDALDIRRVEQQLTIDDRCRDRALNGELAIAIALQAHQAVGHEAVDDGQWQVLERQLGVERALAGIIIGS